MSIWQFAACVDGWNAANNPEAQPEAMTPQEFDEMLEQNADFMSTAVH